jgi:hypothetical protein
LNAISFSKEDYEKKRAEMAKKAKGLSVGVEKLLRENSHLEKEIAEHRGYLNAIKAGKSVKTPYDNARERFEAYRYSYQAEYIRYWLYFFILIGVGFLCCFPQNEYFFENQGKQKNQTSRFMLFVHLGGMTCFYILWPVVGELEEPEAELDFLKRIKKTFEVGCLRHTRLSGRLIQKVALCGGAGAFLLPKAVSADADVFITGEVKYHDYFNYENDILVAEMGHYESEQYTKEIFYSIIQEMFPELEVQITRVNTNPIKYL